MNTFSNKNNKRKWTRISLILDETKLLYIVTRKNHNTKRRNDPTKSLIQENKRSEN